MPNLRGGKAYKKSKGKSKADDEAAKVVFIEKGDDQLIGRIIKLLGNLNVSVYCEDKTERVCRIRSGIKKRVRFETGDIVLLSLRDCVISKEDLEKGIRSENGDILAKYHPQQFQSLKDEGVNPQIFAEIDTLTTAASLMKDGNEAAADAILKGADDDFFDRSGPQEESDSDLDIDNI